MKVNDGPRQTICQFFHKDQCDAFFFRGDESKCSRKGGMSLEGVSSTSCLARHQFVTESSLFAMTCFWYSTNLQLHTHEKMSKPKQLVGAA